MRVWDDERGMAVDATPVGVVWDGWDELRLFDLRTGRALHFDGWRGEWFLLDGDPANAERVEGIRLDGPDVWEEEANRRMEYCSMMLDAPVAWPHGLAAWTLERAA